MANLMWQIALLVGLVLINAGVPTVGMTVRPGDGVNLKSLPRNFASNLFSKGSAFFAVLAALWLGSLWLLYWYMSPQAELPPAGARVGYTVKIHTCMKSPKTAMEYRSHMVDLGFMSEKVTATSTARPLKGTSSQNTVYFYQSVNAEYAQALADKVEAKFGERFDVARGDGVGLKQSEFRELFVVHVIGEECER